MKVICRDKLVFLEAPYYNDPNAGPKISIAGGHGYGGASTHPQDLSKHLWMTEDKIIGVQSGKAVDVDYSSGGTANGTKVQLWDYWNGPSQQVKFTSTDVGQFRITPNCATGSCLDVNGVSTANGAVVQVWQWLNGANQKWSVQAP